jgi:glycosyltransferase involved in cell wall biosynthesis
MRRYPILTVTPTPADALDVSVVVPVRNRARQLETALESVRRQTRRPARVIVVDDASTDDSAQVAQRWGADVIRVPERQGSGLARNRGVQAAQTKHIAFLDSDDAWYPTHLELVSDLIGDLGMVSTAALDTTGRIRGNVGDSVIDLTPDRCFVPENPVVTSTVLVNREALIEAGMFQALDRAQDLDLWVRILERAGGAALPLVTAKYHVRQEWPTRSLANREADFLLTVLGAYQDRPWMTGAVRRGIRARLKWDEMRLAQHEGRRADMVRVGSWFLKNPAALPALGRTLALRQRSRSGGTAMMSESG